MAQTLERKRRELEAEELEYAERLAQARRKEEALNRRNCLEKGFAFTSV